MNARLVITDLNATREFDHKALSKIVGGAGGGPKPKEREAKYWSTMVWGWGAGKIIIVT